MSRILVRSFVKINLSIDVGPVSDDGYHPVDMVMQQLSFHDDVTVEYTPLSPGPCEDATAGRNVPAGGIDPEAGPEAADAGSGSFDIEVRTNRYYLPTDSRNLAYKAALLMAERYGEKASGGKILIDIKKRIPVAGGLAGGSGNGAAVLHALNILWGLRLPLGTLMDLGAELGSDVPFCVMGQARANKGFPAYIKNDPMASSCARATGRGTELEVVSPLDSWMVISKPRFSVSTKEVYQGIDNMKITERPDNDRLVSLLNGSARQDPADGSKAFAKPTRDMYRDFVNVLEAYTLKAYPEVAELKKLMQKKGAGFSLMSGSGPTVFGIFSSMKAAESAALALQKKGLEAYWTRTTV